MTLFAQTVQLSFAEMYERHLVGPLFAPWAELLLERARPRPGERVLDVACGTGIVARLAVPLVGDSSRIVGVDSNEPMLAVARERAPAIDWRPGDAAALPVGEGESFDLVACHQGMQFFADRESAAREMFRVLSPGGRVAVACWAPLDANPFFREIHAVAERQLGPIDDRRHAFGDPVAVASLLAGAGFRDVHAEVITQTVRFSDPAAFPRMNAMALVGMSALAKEGEDRRAGAVAALLEAGAPVVERYTDAGGLAFDAASVVATGWV